MTRHASSWQARTLWQESSSWARPNSLWPSLRALMQAHEIVAVVTQPDRPAGRSRQVRMSPVKRLALEAGAPVMQPKRLRGNDDAIRSAGGNRRGHLRRRRVRADPFRKPYWISPPCGAINVHASLLPRWRGASPIQAAIRAGDANSGATIMLLDAGLDTGHHPDAARHPAGERTKPAAACTTSWPASRRGLARGDTARLAGWRYRAAGAGQRAVHIRAAAEKKPTAKLTGTMTAHEIERQVRAYNPWPLAYSWWDGRRLAILDGRATDGSR